MNEKEKTSYVKALMYIALADDTVEDNERFFIHQIGQIYKLEDETLARLETSILKKEETLDEILSEIGDRKNKLMLLFDLVALCFADGNYSDIERKGMETVSNIMGIENSKLDEIESVLKDHVELQTRVNRILER